MPYKGRTGAIFTEKGMAKELLETLTATSDIDTLICLLFTISDLIDIDYSGASFMLHRPFSNALQTLNIIEYTNERNRGIECLVWL